VKHFPGLGRVRADTHHFAARLDPPLATLEASDRRPFRDVLANSRAALMVGHVGLTALDPDRPASHAKAVLEGLIRRQWNYQGVIITDDLVMGAIYGGDVCQAVVEALNGGAGRLLVAYTVRNSIACSAARAARWPAANSTLPCSGPAKRGCGAGPGREAAATATVSHQRGPFASQLPHDTLDRLRKSVPSGRRVCFSCWPTICSDSRILSLSSASCRRALSTAL
jgi:hypothetical protein